MKTTIIAIDRATSPTLDLLPPSYTYGVTPPKTLLIHTAPKTRMEYADGTPNFIMNYNILVDTNMQANELLESESFYLHQPRLSKSKQALIIANYNKSTINKIYHPRVYSQMYSNDNEVLAETFYADIKETEVLIKHEYGSLGHCQMIVPTYMLDEVLSNINKMTFTKLKEKYPTLKASDNPDSCSLHFDNLGSVLVQDIVPDIKQEYRFLISGKELVGYERQRGIKEESNNYVQALIKTDHEVTLQPAIELLTCKQVETLKRFIDYAGLYFGSLDVYITEDNKMGIFEYCNEFGYSNISANTIQGILLNCMINIAENFRNKKT